MFFQAKFPSRRGKRARVSAPRRALSTTVLLGSLTVAFGSMAQGLPQANLGINHPWWIPIIVISGTALLTWGVIRYRLASSRRREHELKIQVELRTRELLSLGSLTETINRAVRLDDVLEHVWKSFRMVVPYNRIGFAEFDADDREVRAVWARSDASEIKIGSGYSAAIDSTSLEGILDSGKPRIIDDLEQYLEAHPNSGATREIVDEGMRSSLTVPLEAMGRKVGFLFFSSQTPRVYNHEHTRLLERISGQLSLAIEKSRLYERLLETTRQLEDANERLACLAATDSLTGVANRRVFDERLETEWRRCRRNGQPLSLMMIDIDHFKRFNDLHGHLAGDDCLRAVSEALATTFSRAADLVARYGGEEFSAILPETDEDRAARLAENIRRSIEQLDHTGTLCTDGITVSIGVATEIPSKNRSAAELLHEADTCLYAAKDAGRNLVRSGTRIEVPEELADS